MKISKRERNLLIGSGFLILVVVVYLFVITPIHEANELAQTEYDIVDTQYKAVSSQVIASEDMDAIVADYREKIKVLEAELPSAIHLEQIIDLMFDHFNEYDIIINNISFALIEATKEEVVATDDDAMGIENLQEPMSVEEILDEYENSSRLSEAFNVANTLDGEISYDNISYMSINISFVSNYDTLKEVLEGLEMLDLTAVITNINLGKNDTIDEEIPEEEKDDNEVTVSLDLSIPFYYDNEKQKDFIVDYSFEKGADYIDHGPFEYEVIEKTGDVVEEGSSSDDSTTSHAIDPLSISPEFYISLNSKASDLAAQSMSYYKMNNSELNLNANNSEKYKLTLTEENGVIKFRYENDVDAYPSSTTYLDLDSKNNSIIVKVFSSNRISSKDLASMTLVLENNTSKKVLFYVFYDDKDKPRFNVIVNKGSFDIIRD